MNECDILLHRGDFSVSAQLDGQAQETHDAILAQDSNDCIFLVRETVRISECGRSTCDSILKLGPFPCLARKRVDVKDVVFPFRLVWTVQEEVVDAGGREVWDRREQGPENHGWSRWEMAEREGKGHIPLVVGGPLYG